MNTMTDLKKTTSEQAKYYGELFNQHGPSVDAVASGKQIYKNLRYKKLSRVFEEDDRITLHDVGFGLGHYFEFLKENLGDKEIVYSGSEVTKEFVDYCRKVYPKLKFYHRDLATKPYSDLYDYLIFGGTFYHIVDTPENDFLDFIESILENSFKMCKKGMSFNFISNFVDYKFQGLFYANIDHVTKFITEKLSRYFLIDHSYPLYEFTACVYKEEYVRSLFSEQEFLKYYK